MFHRLRSTAVVVLLAAAALRPSQSAALRPSHGPRVVLLGDSNMFGFFGRALQKALQERGFDVIRRAKPGSGLAFPGFYDWFEKGPEYADRYDADVVVVILGGNDGQSLKKRDPWQRRIPWRDTQEWREEYFRRVRDFGQLMSFQGRRLVFLSPTNRRPAIERAKMRRVIEVQRAALAPLPRTWFVNTWALTSNADGRYLADGFAPTGEHLKYRKRDGIHLTEAGALNLRDELLPMLLNEVLQPVRRGR